MLLQLLFPVTLFRSTFTIRLSYREKTVYHNVVIDMRCIVVAPKPNIVAALYYLNFFFFVFVFCLVWLLLFLLLLLLVLKHVVHIVVLFDVRLEFTH